MSAVGFVPVEPEEAEIEKLREACKRLNFTIRSITDAQKHLSHQNLGLVQERLNNAIWQAREAKKTLAEIGRAQAGPKPQDTEKKSEFVDTGDKTCDF